MSQSCPAIIVDGKRAGTVCGRPVKGYVTHGHGRCSYHLTRRERLTVLAIVRAERELRELRALPAEQGQDEQEPGGNQRSEPWTGVDAERFAGPELDE